MEPCRPELEPPAELPQRMDLETYDRLEQARVEQLVATLNLEYPEDIPEMALMTAWGARIFRAQRAELLSDWAWEVAYQDARMVSSVLARRVRTYWLYSCLRDGWIRVHHEDRCIAEGRRYVGKPLTDQQIANELGIARSQSQDEGLRSGPTL